MKTITITIDNSSIERYNEYYFSIHKRAHVPPIKHPYHESINVWMILKRPAMNALKQRWKDFMKWIVNDQGYANLRIDQCELEFSTYYGNNRDHDVDNSTPKFIIDGLVESGFVVDDSNKHVTKLTLQCFSDENNPRTEIKCKVLKG